MQLGKSLLGAIIGAAVGVGLLFVVHSTLGFDKVWLSIPFAIITGLGVRMLVSTAGHASYVRGAMTMVLALAGYIGGWYLVAQIANARTNAQAAKPAAAEVDKPAGESAEAKDTEAEPKDEAVPAEQPKAAAPRVNTPQPRPANPTSFETWDVIWLAIAALVAYEMGRGSGMATRPVASTSAGTHPDA